MSERLQIAEVTSAAGELRPIFLVRDADAVAIASDARSFALPDGALDAVMMRYGAPLDEAEKIREIGALDLGDGRVVRHVRHLAVFDVIARDFIVYERTGEAPLVAMATTVAAVLGHLGLAASTSR